MSLPQHCPSPRELDDLELLLNGAMAPRTGFDPEGGVVTLARPEPGELELVDPEGLPLARVAEDGSLTALSTPAYGAFRRLHLSPQQTREQYDGALFVPVDTYLSATDIAMIEQRRGERPVVLLALSGHGTPRGLSPLGLIRVSLAAADLLGNAHVVAVPLASHKDASTLQLRGSDTRTHQNDVTTPQLRDAVVGNYAAGEVFAHVRGKGAFPATFAPIIESEAERGVVVFFTGLSGSGKSTLARALTDQLLEAGHTVTSLDGDVVRRNLSAGLTFSKEDRETNIRRIGWVAAEIARHRGVAICSPIAPFDSTRKAVRQMVEDAGGQFVLIHVSTPVEECERRDRKGLYAKARAGEIPEFTGISSPYEAPEDATVAVDTTGRTIEDALADVVAALPFKEACDA